MGIFLHYTITFIVVIAPVLVEKYVFQRHFVRKMALYVANYVCKTIAVKVKVEIDDPMEVDSCAGRELVNCEELQEMIRVLTEERDKALQHRWSWSRIATCTGAKQRR